MEQKDLIAATIALAAPLIANAHAAGQRMGAEDMAPFLQEALKAVRALRTHAHQTAPQPAP